MTTLEGSLSFDATPMVLHGFSFRDHSVVPVGRPTSEQFQAALEFAARVEQASAYWIGDLLAYAETREEWRERFDQITAVTGLAHQTILNKTYVARHVDPETRAIAPSETHAKKVAALDKATQRKVLERARDEGLSVSQTEQVAKAMSRPKVIEGRAVLEGQYRVIYADPPWQYRQNAATRDGSLAKAEQHYPTMSIAELCKLPVSAHAMPNAILFLWVTTPLLLQDPGPRDVLDAWGFTYKSGRVWDKVLGNPGNYAMHVRHEHLIVAVRGSCLPDEPLPQADSVETIRRSNVHSEKPEEFRQWIIRHWTHGPYLELFGRKKVKGWTVFGNDARLWKGGA